MGRAFESPLGFVSKVYISALSVSTVAHTTASDSPSCHRETSQALRSSTSPPLPGLHHAPLLASGWGEGGGKPLPLNSSGLISMENSCFLTSWAHCSPSGFLLLFATVFGREQISTKRFQLTRSCWELLATRPCFQQLWTSREQFVISNGLCKMGSLRRALGKSSLQSRLSREAVDLVGFL